MTSHCINKITMKCAFCGQGASDIAASYGGLHPAHCRGPIGMWAIPSTPIPDQGYHAKEQPCPPITEKASSNDIKGKQDVAEVEVFNKEAFDQFMKGL